MDDSKINMYLDQIDRDSATVGINIPEEIEVQGQVIPLKTIVFEVCSEGSIPDSYDLNLSDIKVNLRRERNDMIDRIESGEVTETEAEDIVRKSKQIERSLNAINNPLEEDLESRIKRKEAQDKKKWRNFLNKIKGNEDKRGRR